MENIFRKNFKAGIVLLLLCAFVYASGELDKFYKNTCTLREARVNALNQSLNNFRTVPGLDPSTIDYVVNEFVNAVASKVTTWEELGTDPAELESLARLSSVQSLKTSLANFRTIPGLDPSTIDYVVNEFVNAVASKVTTWEELGTDPAELESLARQNRVKSLKVSLASFRNIPGHDPRTIEYIVNEFESAVASGLTTWKELETDSAELERLANQNKAK